ncbi:hypothetical protein [Bifidobacterium avesanii]|uniref:hypothetical protein n=1 Tax=Bifidobacterium avesanii TaxID=1798157 RepID=UPI0013D87037|nr:hypothetical protein [Bifidobacterium avesanii]
MGLPSLPFSPPSDWYFFAIAPLTAYVGCAGFVLGFAVVVGFEVGLAVAVDLVDGVVVCVCCVCVCRCAVPESAACAATGDNVAHTVNRQTTVTDKRLNEVARGLIAVFSFSRTSCSFSLM